MTGPETAPEAVRQSGLHAEIKSETKWRIDDHGDIRTIGHSMRADLERGALEGARNSLQVGKACENIYTKLLPEAALNNFILTMGGDHSVSLGTLPAIMKQRPRTKVVWVDAHADIQTPDTTATGDLHGMLMGLMMKGVYEPGVESLPGFDWASPCLSPEDIVYIGLRDVESTERAVLKDLGVKLFTMYDIDSSG